MIGALIYVLAWLLAIATAPPKSAGLLLIFGGVAGLSMLFFAVIIILFAKSQLLLLVPWLVLAGLMLLVIWRNRCLSD